MEPPQSGKRHIILITFAAADGFKEYVAPMPEIIQVNDGEATLTVGDQNLEVERGTWLHMAIKTPSSIKATTPRDQVVE